MANPRKSKSIHLATGRDECILVQKCVKIIVVVQILSTFDENLYDLPHFPKKIGDHENLSF